MKIKEIKFWSMMDVRTMCMREGFYTNGDCEAYDKILNFVDGNRLNPSTENIYKVAKDILQHTDEKLQQTVENIMYILANDVIRTSYEIEE